MNTLKELFETVRELAFRQMKFEQLPKEEQDDYLRKNSVAGVYPDWNENLMAEYEDKGTAISFWLDGDDSKLSDMQQAILYAWRDKVVLDGWKVDEVKVETFYGNEIRLDFRVIITSR